MTNQYKTPKEFFDKHSGSTVKLEYYSPIDPRGIACALCEENLTVRELYEHFRNQIFSELGVDDHLSGDRE